MTIARPNLKLEPTYSRVRPGGNVEVDCVSSVGENVNWEGVSGAALPYNFEVIILIFIHKIKLKIDFFLSNMEIV